MQTFSSKSIATAMAAGLLSLGAAGAAGLGSKKKFYSDDPIWSDPKPAVVVNAAARKLSEYYDFFENTFFPQGERAARTGEYLPTQAINTVDEAPDSAWYTNRHAMRPMSVAELQAGPGNTHAPAAGRWTVTAAKNEGITPGFRIRDAAGRQYLLKFDPLSNPEMASAADVITSKFFYALGYNVPENHVVYFGRERIVVGKDAQLRDADGRKRPIRNSDIDDMLAKTPKDSDGRYRALASLLIPGRPLGPFEYHGTRGDDPNDLVAHEHRRDLRGLRTFCAWLGHDDSKSLNTLDVLTDDGGTAYIRHYLIDFGATLGSASFMANSPRDGNVYLFDWKTSAAQLFTFGLYAPKWQHAKYPKLASVGRFEYEVFDPLRWVGDYPNTAFRNENPADRAWAARKIAAFTDDEIRAIAATGRYTDPAAAEWVARCLVERRNKIVARFLRGTAALDRFEARDGRITWTSAGPDAAQPVQVQWSVFDNNSGWRRPIPGADGPQLPAIAEPVDFLVAELTGARGPAVSVYLRMKDGGAAVVGVERHYAARKGAVGD